MKKNYYTATITIVDTEICHAILTIKAENKSSAEIIAENFSKKYFGDKLFTMKVKAGRPCKGCDYAKEEK